MSVGRFQEVSQMRYGSLQDGFWWSDLEPNSGSGNRFWGLGITFWVSETSCTLVVGPPQLLMFGRFFANI